VNSLKRRLVTDWQRLMVAILVKSESGALPIRRGDMTLEEHRDSLLKEKVEEKKDQKYKDGYVDGVLDMYNMVKAHQAGV